MRRINRSQFLTVSVAVMVVTLAVPYANAAPSPPSGPNVTVVNTSTNPVPVVQQGTNVVSGSVSITGTPTVNVGNFPSGTNTVQVSSSTNAPLLVRDVDNPARHPYQVYAIVELGSGANGNHKLFDVPAGKRLVIQFVYLSIGLPPGQKVSAASMSNETTSELPFGVTLPVVPALATQFGGLDGFTFTGPVQLHVDGTFRVQVLRDATLGSGSFGVTISGYLVDVP